MLVFYFQQFPCQQAYLHTSVTLDSLHKIGSTVLWWFHSSACFHALCRIESCRCSFVTLEKGRLQLHIVSTCHVTSVCVCVCVHMCVRVLEHLQLHHVIPLLGSGGSRRKAGPACAWRWIARNTESQSAIFRSYQPLHHQCAYFCSLLQSGEKPQVTMVRGLQH